MDRDQREYHQDVGSTWLVSCRNSPTPARDIAFVLHVAAAIWIFAAMVARVGRAGRLLRAPAGHRKCDQKYASHGAVGGCRDLTDYRRCWLISPACMAAWRLGLHAMVLV